MVNGSASIGVLAMLATRERISSFIFTGIRSSLLQHAITTQTKPIIVDFLSRTAKSKPSIREIAVEGPMCDWYRQRIKNSEPLSASSSAGHAVYYRSYSGQRNTGVP
jgi:hypothetical protein